MLTTLATIKTRLGLEEADVKDDVILTNTIMAVSARFEAECNRVFGRVEDTTEEFSAEETEIRVGSYPIERDDTSGEPLVTKVEVKASEREGWEEETDVDYVVRRGCVVSLSAPLGSYGELGRVTYSGGYVLPGETATTGQTALPSDLEQAAVEQAAYWYQNRDRLGMTSVSGEGGSIAQFAKLDLLPSVAAVLKKHERWMN
jgi:hypothetical protein